MENEHAKQNLKVNTSDADYKAGVFNWENSIDGSVSKDACCASRKTWIQIPSIYIKNKNKNLSMAVHIHNPSREEDAGDLLAMQYSRINELLVLGETVSKQKI